MSTDNPFVKIAPTSILCLLRECVLETLLGEFAGFKTGYFRVYVTRKDNSTKDEWIVSYSPATGLDENKVNNLVSWLEVILGSESLFEIQKLNNGEKKFTG